MMKGIDISTWNDKINYDTLSKNVDFAILRASYGRGYTDARYVQHYNGLKGKVKLGAYHFFYARNIEEAKLEAQWFLQVLAGESFEMPVYIDVEYSDYQGNIDKKTLTDMVIAFLEIIEKAGYYAGVYANLDYFRNKLDDSRLQKYAHWIAQYNNECTYNGSYGMWQYTSNGSVPGITGRVDMNYCYEDYPAAIKKNGLNNINNSNNTPTVPQNPISNGYRYNVGDTVSYSKIFVSSTSTEALNPSISTGKITRIVKGARNPYLINDGTGWVNDSVIVDNFSTNNVYVVKAGDCLSQIAVDLKVSVSYLVSKNNISNPNLIYPGQKIYY